MSGPSPTVLVASEDLSLLDEVVRHIEEIPHWGLRVFTHSADELRATVVLEEPVAVVICDGLAKQLVAQGGEQLSARLVVLGRSEDLAAVRAALRLQAAGFILWPHERGKLQGLVEEGLELREAPACPPGNLVSLWGPKGGSGTSVLAAHLAEVLAQASPECSLGWILVDLDLDHGDQAPILGAEDGANTILHVVRMGDEIAPSVLGGVVWRHPDGLRAILAPGREGGPLRPTEVIGALRALRRTGTHLLVDLPSGFGELAFAVAAEASLPLLVVTPDLLSIRRGGEAVKILRSSGIDMSRVEVVLNMCSGREPISARDVEVVLGCPISATIRPSLGLWIAPDRGQLSRSGLRLLEPLARRIAGPEAPTSARTRRAAGGR